MDVQICATSLLGWEIMPAHKLWRMEVVIYAGVLSKVCLKFQYLVCGEWLDLCGNTNLFGGKLVVLGGDFRQVLPIVPQKTQREAVEASIMTSYLWPKLQQFRLTENIRARDDPQYSSFLLALGNGELQQTENSYVQLPVEIVHPLMDDTDPVTEIMAATFPEFSTGVFTNDVFTKRVVLTPMNDVVDAINSVMIDQFPGAAVAYKSFDSILDDMCTVYPTEFLNTLCPGE